MTTEKQLGEIETQARRQGSLSRMLQNLSPYWGLFAVSGEEPEGVDPQLWDGPQRIGCWILLRMLKAIEGKRPEETAKVLDLMAAEVQRKWAREIAAHSKFKLVSLSEIPPRDTRWIIKPLIPRREITIVDGLPGVGKSWFWQALAAALTGSKSHLLPSGLQVSGVSSILVASAEDDFSEIIRPRLELMNADLRRIYTFRLKLDEGEFVTEAVLLQTELEFSPSCVSNIRKEEDAMSAKRLGRRPREGWVA